jgi:hypothetical protein
VSENEEEISGMEEIRSLNGSEAVNFREALLRRIEAQKREELKSSVPETSTEVEMVSTNDLGVDLANGSEKEAAIEMVADFSSGDEHHNTPNSLQETLLSVSSATKTYLVDDTEAKILANSATIMDKQGDGQILSTVIERETGQSLEPLAIGTVKISEAIADLAVGEADTLQNVNHAIREYADAVDTTGTNLKKKGQERVWDMFRNRFKAVFGVGNGEISSVPVDKAKPAEPENFLERVSSTVEVATRYRNRFNMMFDMAKAAGYEEEHASVDLKKRLAKETLFILSLRNPLRSINGLQDIFFSQRKGAPGRDPEGTPIAEKDAVMTYSESASFFKYAELGREYSQAIERRGSVSKAEQTAYAIRSMLEIAATDKKDKFHILPEKKTFNVWGAKQKEGRDVTFMVFHKDAPYRLTVTVEKGGQLPSIETIVSSLTFLEDKNPSHAISRNDKIKLRRLAYHRDKKESSVVKALGKADFSIVIDETSGISSDQRRRKINAHDSLALTYGRETKACMVLQFEEKNGGQIAKGIDMKFSHPWFNGKDAAEMQFDVAMRMSARAQGKMANNEGSIDFVGIQHVNLKDAIVGQKEADYWKDEGSDLLAVNREAISWLTIPAEEIKSINDRIGALKKKGIPMTLGALTAYAQAVGTGSDSFHQTYHCNRTDDLDIAVGALPINSGHMFNEYIRLGIRPGVLNTALPAESKIYKSRMVRLLKLFDVERGNTTDNRSSISTMAASAGILEPAMKPVAEFLTGVMKKWVADPGTMNSMLISGFDKNNPNADTGEISRRMGTGNMDTYKRLGFEGHTSGYMVPQGFDTAQTASYLHAEGKGVMGGSEVYKDDVSENSGTESRGLSLSMRVDLEQSVVDTAKTLTSLLTKSGHEDDRPIKAKLELELVRLVEIMNNPAESAVKVNLYMIKISTSLGLLGVKTTPVEFAEKLSNAQALVAARRASRVRAGISFVLDVLEAE